MRIDWAPLFGYDIFISYKRGDAPSGQSAYARRLRDRLAQGNFRCFLDESDAPVGAELSPTISRGLRRSRELLVLATPASIASEWVTKEVAEFLRYHRGGIIPINFTGCLATGSPPSGALTPLAPRDAIWIDEDNHDTPSDHVVGAILGRFTHVRANTRRTWFLAAATTVLAIATTLALWQWREAERQRAIAIARLLATRAEQLLDSTDPRAIDRSALVAREALAQFDLPETQFVANKVLRLIGTPIHRMKSPSAVRGVKLGTNGSLYVLSGDATVTAYDWRSGQQRWQRDFGRLGKFLRLSVGAQMILIQRSEQIIDVYAFDKPDPILTVTGTAPVRAAALARDGRHLLTVDDIGTLTLIEVPTGRMIWTRSRTWGHDSNALVPDLIMFSTLNRFVALSTGHVVLLLRVDDGREVMRRAFYDDVRQLVFSRDDTMMVEANFYSSSLVNTDSGEVTSKFVHQDYAHSITFSPDGQLIAVASDASVYLYTLDGRVQQQWPQGMRSVFFGPDGDYVIASDSLGVTRIWSVLGPEETRVVHTGRSVSTDVSDDGTVVVTNNGDGDMAIWRSTSQIRLATAGLPSYSLLPNGREVEWGNASGQEFVLDVEHETITTAPATEQRGVNGSADASTSALMAAPPLIPVPLAPAQSIEPSRGESLSSAELPTVRIRFGPTSLEGVDRNSGKVLWVKKDPTGFSAEFTPSRSLLICRAGTGERFVVRARTGERIWTEPPDTYLLGISPDDQWLANRPNTPGEDEVQVLSLSTSRVPLTLRQPARVRHVLFSPDASELATVGDDDAVRIFDLKTGAVIQTLQQDREVAALAWSSDSRRIAISTVDLFTRIADVRSGIEVSRLPAPQGVKNVAFARDDTMIVAVGSRVSANNVFVSVLELLVDKYPVDVRVLVDRLCTSAGRDLSSDEWTRYVGLEPGPFPCRR